jgi:tetratricopeptide (TPR) repeat protein
MSDPDNGWAYRNKGLYFLLKGNTSEAIRLLEKAHSMDPFIERIDLYLGEAYLAAGDRAKGCLHLDESVKRGDLSLQSKSERCH